MPKKISIQELASHLDPNSTRNNPLPSPDGKTNVKSPRLALFLGAGASKDSGIILANDMIKHFINEICKAEDPPIIDEKEQQDWVKARNYYASEKDKYGALFDLVYGSPELRREYMERLVEGKTPSLGYIALAQLIKKGFIDVIITTNFDDLINQACTSYTDTRPAVFSLGNFASEITTTTGRPRILKIHGDYMFKRLRNTRDEFNENDPNMTKEISQVLENYYGLIVIGYAGNDKSVLRMFESIDNDKSVYWFIRKDDGRPNDEVLDLLLDKKGFIVEIEEFDKAMMDLFRFCVMDHGELVSTATIKAESLYKEFLKFSARQFGDVPERYKVEATLSRQKEKINKRFEALLYIVLGDVAFNAKNITDARALFERAVDAKPKEADTHYNLGKALAENPVEFDKAEAQYKEAIELKDDDAYAYSRYGELLLKQGIQLDDAKKLISKALGLRKDYAPAAYNFATLGLIMDKADRTKATFEKAERLLVHAADIDKTFIKPLISLISIYRHLDEKDKVKEYLPRAKELLSSADLYDKACFYSVIGISDETFKYLSLAVKENPHLKNFARIDPNLEWIHDDPKFKEIVGESE